MPTDAPNGSRRPPATGRSAPEAADLRYSAAAVLILLLPACGYPSYYPTPDYVADTSDMDTSAGMPCGATWSFDAVELRYVDNSGGPGLMLHSVQEDCSEWVIGPVSQREVGSYPTNPGAVFAARTSTGELYAWTQVPFGEAIWPWSIE